MAGLFLPITLMLADRVRNHACCRLRSMRVRINVSAIVLSKATQE